MKIKELIKQLSEYGEDSEVYVEVPMGTPNAIISTDFNGFARDRYIRTIKSSEVIPINKSAAKYGILLQSTPYFLFELECVDGGNYNTYGKKGDKKQMCAPGDTEEVAIIFVKQNLPGGWTYKCLGPTNDTFYLRT